MPVEDRVRISEPEVIAREIAENPGDALAQFSGIVETLSERDQDYRGRGPETPSSPACHPGTPLFLFLFLFPVPQYVLEVGAVS